MYGLYNASKSGEEKKLSTYTLLTPPVLRTIEPFHQPSPQLKSPRHPVTPTSFMLTTI